jgi:hypothetical protein
VQLKSRSQQKGCEFIFVAHRTFLGKLLCESHHVSSIMAHKDQCLPRCYCCPLEFMKTELGGKKNGMKTPRLEYLSVLWLTFFNLTIFGANARSMLSQPKDRCSPCRPCRPLAFIKTERGGKNNGEKTSCLEYLTVLQLIFFQLNHFWDERTIHHNAAHRPMFAPSSLRLACVYKN